MVKKIYCIGFIFIIFFSLSACLPIPEEEYTYMNILHETAIGWGYEGDINEFKSILLGISGNEKDEEHADLSAYEIYIKNHSDYYADEEEWINDLIIRGRKPIKGYWQLLYEELYDGVYFEKEKIDSTATIDDDFADNMITVRLSHEASIAYLDNEYTILNFLEIEVYEIEKVSMYDIEEIKEQLLTYKEKGKKPSPTLNSELSKVEKFSIFLNITIKKESKNHVISIIKLLEKRNDIKSVTPNYFCYLD